MTIFYNLDFAGFFAASQKGKTTLWHKIYDGVDKSKFYILDTNDEYADYPNRTKVGTYDTTSATLDKFIRTSREDYSKHVVFEDIEAFDPQNSKELDVYAINGMHQNIGCTVISRRILGLNKKLLLNMRYFFLGWGLISNDIEYLLADNLQLTAPHRSNIGSGPDWLVLDGERVDGGQPITTAQAWELYLHVQPFQFLYHDRITRETYIFALPPP